MTQGTGKTGGAEASAGLPSIARARRLGDLAPPLLLAAALVAFIVVVLSYGSGHNFLNDEWEFLIYRRPFSADSFFRPHGEHISVIPVAVYKALMATFGISSTAPYRVVSVTLLTGTAVLLFVFLRSRIGAWLALLATALMLFLGPAWQDILWPFEMTLVGSLASGIGMLLALERRDRLGDRAACALLIVSVLCSSLGLAFIVAAAVDVALRRGSWRQRAYIPAIPAAVYLVWYATYGYVAAHHVTVHNIIAAPVYLAAGVASSLQSLFGMWPTGQVEHIHPTWGWALLGLLIVGLIIRVRRGSRPSHGFWRVVAAGVFFWLLGALDYTPARGAANSRFQYIGAAFVLMAAAELFRGWRIRYAAVWAALVITGLALWANIAILGTARTYLDDQSALSRADLGAIEIARRTVDPDFTPTAGFIAGPATLPFQAGPYLAAVDAMGSPADRPRAIAAEPESVRLWADVVLGHALPVSVATGTAGVRPSGEAPRVRGVDRARVRVHGACAVLPAGSARTGVVFEPTAPNNLIRVGKGSSATVYLRHFASSSYAFTPGTVDGGTAAVLDIPMDRSAIPWHVRVSAAQTLEICGARLRRR